MSRFNQGNDLPLYLTKKVNPVNPLHLIKNNDHKTSKPAQSFSSEGKYLLSLPDKTRPIKKEKIKLKKDANTSKFHKTRMCVDGIECKKRFTCNYAHN